jgi:hypothetical protein
MIGTRIETIIRESEIIEVHSIILFKRFQSVA